MASGAMASMWSRETTAESSSGASFKRAPSKMMMSTGLTECDLPPVGLLTMTRNELEELLDTSIRHLTFAVSITGHSETDSSPILCALSRGFEELYEWPRESLLGARTYILDARSGNCETEMKSQMAQIHGAEVSIFQTQRTASGEIIKTFQYKRGLSLGSWSDSGDEVWYLLTVSFDISADFERECQGAGSVDRAFFLEAASSIASQVKSAVTEIISTFSKQHARMADKNKTCASQSSEAAVTTEGQSLLHLDSPEWVECSPALTKMLEGLSQARRA